MILETNRLILRHFIGSDAESIYERTEENKLWALTNELKTNHIYSITKEEL